MMATGSADYAVYAMLRKRRTVIIYRYVIALGAIAVIAGAVLQFASQSFGVVILAVGGFVGLVAVAALAITAIAAGLDVCDNNGDYETVDRFFRPDGPAYHRCRHSPPHCYEMNGAPMVCP